MKMQRRNTTKQSTRPVNVNTQGLGFVLFVASDEGELCELTVDIEFGRSIAVACGACPCSMAFVHLPQLTTTTNPYSPEVFSISLLSLSPAAVPSVVKSTAHLTVFEGYKNAIENVTVAFTPESTSHSL